MPLPLLMPPPLLLPPMLPPVPLLPFMAPLPVPLLSGVMLPVPFIWLPFSMVAGVRGALSTGSVGPVEVLLVAAMAAVDSKPVNANAAQVVLVMMKFSRFKIGT